MDRFTNDTPVNKFIKLNLIGKMLRNIVESVNNLNVSM